MRAIIRSFLRTIAGTSASIGVLLTAKDAGEIAEGISAWNKLMGTYGWPFLTLFLLGLIFYDDLKGYLKSKGKSLPFLREKTSPVSLEFSDGRPDDRDFAAEHESNYYRVLRLDVRNTSDKPLRDVSIRIRFRTFELWKTLTHFKDSGEFFAFTMEDSEDQKNIPADGKIRFLLSSVDPNTSEVRWGGKTPCQGVKSGMGLHFVEISVSASNEKTAHFGIKVRTTKCLILPLEFDRRGWKRGDFPNQFSRYESSAFTGILDASKSG